MTSRKRNWLHAAIIIACWLIASEMSYQDELSEQQVTHGN